MRDTGPDNSLNRTEIESLQRLEAVAQRGLGTYTDVGEALAEIRDAQLYRGTHPTFEAYLSDRWGISDALSVRGDGTDAVAKVCRQVLRALGSSELTGADIHLTLHTRPTQIELPAEAEQDPAPSPDLVSDRLLVQLRWLLTQSAGTIADVAYQLETHPFDVDERTRDQLRDDVLVIEDELATLKMFLAFVDWDAELGRLLGGEDSPPTDGAPEDE